VATFVAYDDDGHTYGYEKGEYFRQETVVKRSGRTTEVAVSAATGTYQAQFPSYLFRVHQSSESVTSDGGRLKKFPSESAFRASTEPGWFATTDKFGTVTEVRVPTDAKPHTLTLPAH
jgi:alpha-glucosidase